MLTSHPRRDDPTLLQEQPEQANREAAKPHHAVPGRCQCHRALASEVLEHHLSHHNAEPSLGELLARRLVIWLPWSRDRLVKLYL